MRQQKTKATRVDPSMDEALQTLVNKSGHRLHCQVANFFRSNHWTTRLSQYYVDATTDKARELDLIAEKVFEFPHDDNRHWVYLHVRLCIECKYIDRPVVFWFDTIDSQGLTGWVDERRPFNTRNEYSRQMHCYSTGDVAKLFSSGKDAEESEPIFRAVNQCLHGFVNTSGRSIADVRSRPNVKPYHLTYPMIVFSSFDQFYRTDVKDGPTPVRLTDNFSLEVNYAYPNQARISVPRYLLVDMVSVPTLGQFLQALEKEVQAAKILA